MSDKDEILGNKKQDGDDTIVNEETTEAGAVEETEASKEVQSVDPETTASSEIVNQTEETEASLDQPEGEQEAQASAPAAGGAMKLLPWIVAAVAVVALIAVLLIPSGNKETLATVNGEKITRQDLNEYMFSQIGKPVLNNMINETLIDQEAKKAGITVTEADIDAEIDKMIKSYPSPEQFEFSLAQSGMSLSDLKNQMKTDLKIRKILEPTITITDEEIKKTYDENKESFATPEQVKASHILVETKEDAEAILKELKGGADFATMAKEKSKDGSASQGGDLGYFGRGDMVPEFEEAAFKLNVGEISEVVQSNFGFHIIKVTDKKAAATPTFEEKKEEIREQLVNMQMGQKVPEWMQKIQADAKIVNKLEEKPEASATPAPTAAP
jgi:foldase protein PrsA